MVRSNCGLVQNRNSLAASSCDSAQSKSGKAPHTGGRPRRRYTTVRLSMRADYYSMAHSSVTAADTSGSRSRNHGHYSMGQKMAGCRYKPVRSSASSRFPTRGRLRKPPMEADLHA